MTNSTTDEARAVTLSRSTRRQYSKREGRVRKFVIAVFYEDKPAEFFDQISGEPQWYKFSPSASEFQLALRLRVAAPSGDSHWPRVDINGEEGLDETSRSEAAVGREAGPTSSRHRYGPDGAAESVACQPAGLFLG
jgi:hypothetical protein